MSSMPAATTPQPWTRKKQPDEHQTATGTGDAIMVKLSDQMLWLLVRRIAKRTFWISLATLALSAIVSSLVPDLQWRTALTLVADTALLVTLLATLAWIIAGTALWWLKGPIRWGIFAPRVRKAYLLAVFDDAITTARNHRLHLVRVLAVYQVAQRGTKCVVEHPGGIRQDAWFWAFNPKRGCVFMVRSDTAYGPHNSNAHVMYVGTNTTGSGVVGGIPASAWKAAHKRMRQQH